MRSASSRSADRPPEPAATPALGRASTAVSKRIARRRLWTRWNSPSPRPTSRSTAELRAYAARSFRPGGRSSKPAPRADPPHLHRDFTYDPKATTIGTGSARCSRHAAWRLPGLRPYPDRLPARAGPAGALRQRLPADRPPEGKERLVGADASHAWVSVWIPGYGWVDLDPTNDVIPAPRAHHRRLGPRLWRRQPGGRA